ncbi:hypothetical protein NA57DRAFT_72461 [Rhizodiscina lignyota]|uniref:Uncharacterized protein n=1 Tax=Rhizodiscina lignyota TaxID=1504668 RepID=A0A9P4ISJ9_9PEZI|nr:hypothetical protein NA57DRAFT_72461 [Rhizodiscina lignyota]
MASMIVFFLALLLSAFVVASFDEFAIRGAGSEPQYEQVNCSYNDVGAIAGKPIPDTSCGLHHEGFLFYIDTIASFIEFYGGQGANSPTLANITTDTTTFQSMQLQSADVACFLSKDTLGTDTLVALIDGLPKGDKLKLDDLKPAGSLPEQCEITAFVFEAQDGSKNLVGQSHVCQFKPPVLLSGPLGSEFGLSVEPTPPQRCTFPATWKGVTKIGFNVTMAPINAQLLPAKSGGVNFGIDNCISQVQKPELSIRDQNPAPQYEKINCTYNDVGAETDVPIPDTSCGLHHEAFDFMLTPPGAFILEYGGQGAHADPDTNPISNITTDTTEFQWMQPRSVDVACYLAKRDILQAQAVDALLRLFPGIELEKIINLESAASLPEQCQITVYVYSVAQGANEALVGQQHVCPFNPPVLLSGKLGSELGLSITPTPPLPCIFPEAWKGVTKIGFKLTSAPINSQLLKAFDIPTGDGGVNFAIDNFVSEAEKLAPPIERRNPAPQYQEVNCSYNDAGVVNGNPVQDTSCGIHHEGLTYNLATAASFIQYYGGQGATGNTAQDPFGNITTAFATTKFQSMQPLSVDVACYLSKASLLQLNTLSALLSTLSASDLLEIDDLDQAASLPEKCEVTAYPLAIADGADKQLLSQTKVCTFNPPVLLSGELGQQLGLSVSPTPPQPCTFPGWKGVTKLGFKITKAPINSKLAPSYGGVKFGIDNYVARAQLLNGS